MSPALQRREIVSAVFQNAALVRRADQTLYRFVPARKHLQEFTLPSFGRIDMARIGICGGVPGEPVAAGIEDAKAFSSTPSFAVRAGRSSARKTRQPAPDGVTPVDGLVDSKNLETNARADTIGTDNEVVFRRDTSSGHTSGEVNSDAGLALLEGFEIVTQANPIGRECREQCIQQVRAALCKAQAPQTGPVPISIRSGSYPHAERTRKCWFGPLDAATPFKQAQFLLRTRVALGQSIIPAPTSRNSVALS